MIEILDNLYIFDCEVYKYNWLFCFKNPVSGGHLFIWDNPAWLSEFIKQDPLLCGYNNKHYDSYIIKAAMMNLMPQEIKAISDAIIVQGIPGWQIPELKNCGIYFRQFDLMDDTQKGTSLKDIEGHLGMNIMESSVPFDIDRPLTFEEKREVEAYCLHDVDATHVLYQLREVYISNKLKLAEEKGIDPAKALYMTNAKLTATYLDAKAEEHRDEREYLYPTNLRKEYIPQEVFDFFDRMKDPSISDEELFSKKLSIDLGGTPTIIGFGGIHAGIPNYRFTGKEPYRLLRNFDVASFYPSLILKNGYCSRNIASDEAYKAVYDRRISAKKSGDNSTANALKLVLNTTYGATLSQFNDLYDPLKARSVCISGQLYLLELANHLLREVESLKIVNLNTDGIMVDFDGTEYDFVHEVVHEWEERTGFNLEEDIIDFYAQKDVNNLIEITSDKSLKVRGGYLVRGLVTNGNIDFEAMGFHNWKNLGGGAFKINNNCVIVSEAVIKCIAYGIPVEDTINACQDLIEFQIIAKTWAKCGNAYHMQFGDMVEVQRVNRVYATDKWEFGTLYMLDPDAQDYRKVTGVPEHLLVDNDNHLTIDVVDRDWYIRLAKKYVNDFRGIKIRRNAAVTRKINKMKKEILKLL